jgi:hypothetical protein
MDREPGKFFDVQWVAQCAHRLRERWPHADVVSLEEAAIELWNDEALRAMPAAAAAERWLAKAGPLIAWRC